MQQQETYRSETIREAVKYEGLVLSEKAIAYLDLCEKRLGELANKKASLYDIFAVTALISAATFAIYEYQHANQLQTHIDKLREMSNQLWNQINSIKGSEESVAIDKQLLETEIDKIFSIERNLEKKQFNEQILSLVIGLITTMAGTLFSIILTTKDSSKIGIKVSTYILPGLVNLAKKISESLPRGSEEFAKKFTPPSET